MKLKQIISFIITPMVIIWLMVFIELDAANPKVTATFCIALLMAVWWITEIVPLAITSLLPVALFPLFGIMDGKAVSATYFNDVIFLFMGGFLVALAMERWNLHKRIALSILAFTGVSPARILLGFMASSFFLSMWISNTATVMMMLPIVMSIIGQLDSYMNNRNSTRFSAGLLLGIAYSASIGGMATLVGTPPNLSLSRIYTIYFPHLPEISFSGWIIFALPVSLILFAITWAYLFLSFKPKKGEWIDIDKLTFHNQLKEMGRTTFEEKFVFVTFTLLALLWIFRADLTIGRSVIPGWSGIFPAASFINDGTVAIFMALILFIIPSRSEKGAKILDWPTASKLPWQILLLFGGGFALATGFKESGLSLWFGNQLAGVASLHPIVIILVISLFMTFLTELTSNTATTEMILPILAGIAITTNINPLLLMIPATLSASMAFMLPVATPPNAIIFGTSRISVGQMAKTGLFLNLVGAVVITLMMYFWGSFVFNIN
ncbi:MAG: sodium:dicarboxylate symporter [Bacteroidetes bacterium HGW-Bacteroidetes-8]|nr:MAG: sodium:dicarboxylate symporter [Bacteroidetes bacterium HGW-Bacteroidetes-8]